MIRANVGSILRRIKSVRDHGIKERLNEEDKDSLQMIRKWKELKM